MTAIIHASVVEVVCLLELVGNRVVVDDVVDDVVVVVVVLASVTISTVVASSPEPS